MFCEIGLIDKSHNLLLFCNFNSILMFNYNYNHIMDMLQDVYAQPFDTKQQSLEQIANYFSKVFHQPASTIGNEQIMAENVGSSKSNTILMDVLRTRSSLISKEHKQEMQKVLNHFCRLSKLEYKQGLNEILAPFIYFRLAGYSLSKCYALFKTFFDRYCLNFYYDKDFNSLEILFKMITIVIKYHDPALARYLENYEIQPQIYCISWLMTLFSSKLSLRLTYLLWQFIITEKDDYFIFFLIIAIIISRREEIIATKNSSIFTVITNLIFKNESELMHTIKIALLLRRNTPSSLILFFKEKGIFKEKKSFERIGSLLQQIDKVNVFLVGSGQVSLREHLKLGLCERHCYFCSLRQPLKIPYQQYDLVKYFPVLNPILKLANDIRCMDFNIEFIVLDVRKNKEIPLPKIEGISIYPIDITVMIEAIEANFTEHFMQMMGKEHFLFVLNEFSFEKMSNLVSEQFFFCKKLIKILNSYSYNYLSILEGGEQAYFDFLRSNKLKSQLLNSKLVPVSEAFSSQIESAKQELTFIDKQEILEVSQIIYIQRLYDHHKLSYFFGAQTSEQIIIFVLEGLILFVQRNKLLEKLLKHVKQKKSIMALIIQERWVLRVPFKIIFMHSIYMMDKLTVRLHHNNCLILYTKETPNQSSKSYRRGLRNHIWQIKLQAIVRQDLQLINEEMHLRRVNFDTLGLEEVKQISGTVKQHYKNMVRIKRHIQEELLRKDDLKNNIIQQQGEDSGLLH